MRKKVAFALVLAIVGGQAWGMKTRSNPVFATILQPDGQSIKISLTNNEKILKALLDVIDAPKIQLLPKENCLGKKCLDDPENFHMLEALSQLIPYLCENKKKFSIVTIFSDNHCWKPSSTKWFKELLPCTGKYAPTEFTYVSQKAKDSLVEFIERKKNEALKAFEKNDGVYDTCIIRWIFCAQCEKLIPDNGFVQSKQDDRKKDII